MKLPENVVLDLRKDFSYNLSVKQNDIGSRYLDMTIKDNGQVVNLTNHTAKLYIEKPDGTIIFNNAIIVDAVAGIVEIELTSQALAVAGLLKCELAIYGTDASVVSSKIFSINVTYSLRNDTAIESQNEFGALIDGMASLAEYENYKAKIGADTLGTTAQNISDAINELVYSDNTIQAQLEQNQTQLINLETNKADKSEINNLATEKANQTDLNITNANLSNTNAQISNIVAHNGDGTKDSEIILARNNETTLNDRLNNIDAGGVNLIEPGMEEPGVPFYGTNVFNGWGMIMSLKATKISQIGVAKGSTASVSTNIVVRLFETSSVTSISAATQIQEWTILLEDWNALSVGVTKKLNLTTPYTTISGKYYAVTIYGTNVNTMQAGDKDGVIHTKYSGYKQGLYCTDSTNTTYMTANYGTYCKIYQDVLLNKTLILAGNQVPSHDMAITSMQSDVNIIKKTGYYDKNSEENGTGGYINSLDVATAKGWGAIVKTKLPQITKIAVKKVANKSKTYTATTISVKLYETPDYNILTNATLIEAFSIPIADWQASGGNEIPLTLTTPYTTINGKYYAVTVFAGETVDVQQVGINGAINIPTNSCYKFGIWTPSSDDKTNYSSAGGGSYGLYFKFYNGDADIYLNIKGEQVQDHNSAIKDLQSNIANLQTVSSNVSRYNFPHELHYENPLLKTPVFTKHWLTRDKDLYVDLYGDSISALQTATTKPDVGVTRVPPTCDRLALAGLLWNIVQFGTPIYRRFDDGKNALVGSWDNRWVSADAPVFTEVGTFETYYSGNLEGKDVTEYNSNTSLLYLTSKISKANCPITKFCQYDGERHVPKRISNSANASVTFVIPSGYKKFDFLYHTNQQGDDNVTVTIAEGSGKVHVSTIKRDFTIPVDANNFVFSTKEIHTEAEDGYDNGVLNRRLYFEKVNIDDVVTVTITKSSDATKYLMYWGMTYWGTATEPNACHLLVTGRGAYNIASQYSKRYHDIGLWNIDLIIMEHTMINSSSAWIDNDTYYTDKWTLFYNYINSLGIEIFSLLPHAHVGVLNSNPIRYKQYWNFTKADCITKGVPCIDIERAYYKMWQYKYPNKEVSYVNFVASLMYDSITHPNDAGFDIYKLLLEPIFDMI